MKNLACKSNRPNYEIMNIKTNVLNKLTDEETIITTVPKNTMTEPCFGGYMVDWFNHMVNHGSTIEPWLNHGIFGRGNSTHISTRSTLTPHGSVASSRLACAHIANILFLYTHVVGQSQSDLYHSSHTLFDDGDGPLRRVSHYPTLNITRP